MADQSVKILSGLRRAAPASGGLSFAVGGHTVFLRAPFGLMARALSHLPRSSATPSLTIRSWESPASPVDLDVSGLGRHGLISGMSEGKVLGAHNPGSGSLSAIDLSSMEAFFWAPSAEGMPPYEWAAPLRLIMHWWAGSGGMVMAHAAAVGARGGGALIVGSGGSGKSTLAVACAAAGAAYVGDDYCLVDPASGIAWSLYCTAKLDGPSISRIPRAKDLAFWGTSGKSILDLSRSSSLSVPVKAVVVPRVGGGPVSVSEVSPAAALLALAPSTMLQLPSSSQKDLDSMARLVSRVPCYSVTVGEDVMAAAEVVLGLVG